MDEVRLWVRVDTYAEPRNRSIVRRQLRGVDSGQLEIDGTTEGVNTLALAIRLAIGRDDFNLICTEVISSAIHLL